MARRRGAILAAGYPYPVAGRDGAFAGYAYASAYRRRPACRHAAENSVYVAPGTERGGTGTLLLEALVSRCEAQGFHLMAAVIGDSANAPSIDLHARASFARAAGRLTQARDGLYRTGCPMPARSSRHSSSP